MLILIFFFKQKTAYEMRISDWSSDGCSSELESSSRSPPSSVCDAGCCAAGKPCAADPCGRRFDYHAHPRAQHPGGDGLLGEARGRWAQRTLVTGGGDAGSGYQRHREDRTSVVEGKSVSVRVVLGGCRNLKKKKEKQNK